MMLKVLEAAKKAAPHLGGPPHPALVPKQGMTRVTGIPRHSVDRGVGMHLP